MKKQHLLAILVLVVLVALVAYFWVRNEMQKQQVVIEHQQKEIKDHDTIITQLFNNPQHLLTKAKRIAIGYKYEGKEDLI